MAGEKKIKKEEARFEPFVENVIRGAVTENAAMIREICSKEDEISGEDWDCLNRFVIGISSKAVEWKYRSHNIVDVPFKKDRSTITSRVREMQRKQCILKWLELGEDGSLSALACYQTFTHIVLWLRENSRQEKAEKKREED